MSSPEPPWLQNGAGNSLAVEQGFSGFYWVLNVETEIPEKCPNPCVAPGYSMFSDSLSFLPSVEGTGFSSVLPSSACPLEEGFSSVS